MERERRQRILEHLVVLRIEGDPVLHEVKVVVDVDRLEGDAHRESIASTDEVAARLGASFNRFYAMFILGQITFCTFGVRIADFNRQPVTGAALSSS